MNSKEVQVLSGRTILRKAMKDRNVTQVMLSGVVGMRQTAISQSLTRTRIGLGVFAKLLSALDYDVVIQDRETGEVVYKLDTEPLLDDDV